MVSPLQAFVGALDLKLRLFFEEFHHRLIKERGNANERWILLPMNFVRAKEPLFEEGPMSRIFMVFSYVFMLTTATWAGLDDPVWHNSDSGHLARTVAVLLQVPGPGGYWGWDRATEEKFAETHLERVATISVPSVGGLRTFPKRLDIVFRLKPETVKTFLRQILASLENKDTKFRVIWPRISFLEDLAVIELNNIQGVILVDFKGTGVSLGKGRVVDTTGWRFYRTAYPHQTATNFLAMLNQAVAQVFATRAH